LEINLHIKPKKRLLLENPEPLSVPRTINAVWSMDFMHDQLSDGRSFRIFNVINTERPSMAIGGITPMQKRAMVMTIAA